MNDTTRLDETRWFGIKLNHTSRVILFYLALIGVIEGTNLWLSISTLINYIQIFGILSEYVSRQIFSIITGVSIFVIFCYTLLVCSKSRKDNKNNQNNTNTTVNTIRWFGFTLSQTMVIILFFLALIGIPPTIYSLYYYIFYLRDIVQSFLYYGGDWIYILGALSIFQLISTLIAKLVLFSYSIVKFSQVRKNMERMK